MPERPPLLCASDDVRCPSCGTRVHGIELEDGTAWLRCDGKRELAGRRERCNQWMHLYAPGRGVSLVLAVSGDEAARYRPQHLGPLQLYQVLGVVASRRWPGSAPPHALNLSRVAADGTRITHLHLPKTDG